MFKAKFQPLWRVFKADVSIESNWGGSLVDLEVTASLKIVLDEDSPIYKMVMELKRLVKELLNG